MKNGQQRRSKLTHCATSGSDSDSPFNRKTYPSGSSWRSLIAACIRLNRNVCRGRSPALIALRLQASTIRGGNAYLDRLSGMRDRFSEVLSFAQIVGAFKPDSKSNITPKRHRPWSETASPHRCRRPSRRQSCCKNSPSENIHSVVAERIPYF